MEDIWKELIYPEWFERFKRIWGKLEVSEIEIQRTMKMWKCYEEPEF